MCQLHGRSRRDSLRFANGARRCIGVRSSFRCDSRLNATDSSDSAVADYSAFVDVLSSLSCFKWNATSLEELREGHSRLVPAVCGPRENKAYTAVDEEYFFDKEDPIFSRRCRVWMYVDAHKDSLRRYTRYFVVSVCIVATVAGLFVCVDEVGVWAGVNGSCGR